jgi:hypothetical protein
VEPADEDNGDDPLKRKLLTAGLILLVALTTACERQATRSTWAPLGSAQPRPSMASTSASAMTPGSPEATRTPRRTPTPVKVATLDLDDLADKYPLAAKGYELVSWQKDGEWVYTLLAGTNRQKSFDEILAEENTFNATEIFKITVVGEEAFKEVIDRLSKGEWIIWGGMDLAGEVPAGTLYFSYPDQAIMDDLIKYCKGKGITLVSLREE